ncbi:hypothetical protein [Limnohabitans sp. Rim8]|uniref:hypothetical protein n=1 Tax=Limnohabitans sp. Rim8 TaxID=1100718 RepID=UPI003305E94F
MIIFTKENKCLKQLKKVAALGALALLTACGGGGDSSSGYGSGENITYITVNGLKWSSPSSATYIYKQPMVSTLELDANAYCSQSTSTNGGPQIPTNFNKEDGWSIPSETQLRALRAVMPAPTNWQMVDLWVQPLSTSQWFTVYTRYINFATGGLTLPSADMKAHVTCIKPI